MNRRLVLAICLLATIGGAAGTAFAEAPVAKRPHQVCLVLTKTDGSTQDYCVDWTAAQPR